MKPSINQKNLKLYIKNFVKKQNFIITDSSRHCYHIRFKLKGNLDYFNKIFNPIHIQVLNSNYSCSSKSPTYILKALKDITGIPKNTELFWVNNEISLSNTGSKIFSTKDLSPDSLNITDCFYNCKELIEKVKCSILEKNYSCDIKNQLISLLKYSQKKRYEIYLDKELTFNNNDLTTISKDYGEILSSIWIMSNLNFAKVYFPKNSNEKLIDFYGEKISICYPISIKSGKGGKVLLQNIIDAINKRNKTPKKRIDNQSSFKIIKIVNDNTMKSQMIKLHQYLETKMIEDLATIMDTKINNITEKLVREWTSSKSIEELKIILEQWWKNYSQPKKFNINDRERLIISPLGEKIKFILNNDKKLQESLNYLARQISVLQINIDIKKDKIIFKKSFFKDSNFEFGWPGYSSGNKLGFRIKT